MPTSECLVTRLLHHVETLSFSANVSECWLHTWGCLCQLLLAEPAERSIVLVTCLAGMVWFSVAFGAEVLLTTIASDPVVRHVLGSLSRDWLSFVIFLTFDYISWLHHHDVTASTTYHVGVLFNYLHLLILVNRILLLLI